MPYILQYHGTHPNVMGKSAIQRGTKLITPLSLQAETLSMYGRHDQNSVHFWDVVFSRGPAESRAFTGELYMYMYMDMSRKRPNQRAAVTTLEICC